MFGTGMGDQEEILARVELAGKTEVRFNQAETNQLCSPNACAKQRVEWVCGFHTWLGLGWGTTRKSRGEI